MSEYTDRTAGPDLNIKTDFGDTSTTPGQRAHVRRLATDWAISSGLNAQQTVELLDALLGDQRDD